MYMKYILVYLTQHCYGSSNTVTSGDDFSRCYGQHELQCALCIDLYQVKTLISNGLRLFYGTVSPTLVMIVFLIRESGMYYLEQSSGKFQKYSH